MMMFTSLYNCHGTKALRYGTAAKSLSCQGTGDMIDGANKLIRKKAVSQQILFEQAREIRTRKGTHIHISPPTKTPPKPKKGGSNSCKSKAETQTTHTQYIRNNGQNCFFPLLALGARH